MDHEATMKREAHAEDERSLGLGGVGAPSHLAPLPLDSIPVREE